MKIFLKIRYYKCCITIELIYAKESILQKVCNSECNGCHDSTMVYINISDIAVITVKNADYHCIIHNITKSEAINLLENSVLENCVYIYKKHCLIFSLFKIFFVLFLFSKCKILHIHKSLNVNIGTVMKNSEVLNFACKRAFEKISLCIKLCF